MTDDFEAALRAAGATEEEPGMWWLWGNTWEECHRPMQTMRKIYEVGREHGRRDAWDRVREYFGGHDLIKEAGKALERLEARKGEDVDEWAQRLARDVGDATD